MNIIGDLGGSLAAPHKVGKACFSSVVTYHAASSAASRSSSVSPSRRPSALSASNSSTGLPDSGSGQWDSYTSWQLQTDMFRGHGGGNGGLFGGGGQGGSGRPGFRGGNSPFGGGDGPSAQQFMFVGLKPDHASSFMGAVWHLLSVVCMMQTFGFLLYGDYAGGDVWQDECFDKVEI